MKKENIQIENIPSILYGTDSDELYIFVHGKHSQKEEAANFACIATKNGYQVLSFDLPEHGERKNQGYTCSIQNGIHDLKIIYSFVEYKYKKISLYACSLGAYFSLIAYHNIRFDKCLFLSPILNMKRLIKNMLNWSNVSEIELKEKSEIETSFGEILSWDYYEFVRNNPVKEWNNQTFILYGENDSLTEKAILKSFVKKNNCNLNIMANGEHFFQTKEQLNYLDNWIEAIIK